MRALLPASLFAFLLFTSTGALGAADTEVPPLFASGDVLEVTLDAPFDALIAKSRTDQDFSVRGTLTYADPRTGQTVTLKDVTISTRGNTSRRTTECSFPKLKVVFDAPGGQSGLFDGPAIKIGTHCSDKADGELTPKFGRLANEKAVHREAFVYRLLAAMDVPALLARPARITYVDGTRDPLIRNAMFLEDDDQAVKRLGGTDRIPPDRFTSAREVFASADTARLAFAHAMLGNFDWCLRMVPGDTYRCNETNPLWNTLAVVREGRKALPVVQDFDLAGVVTGRHIWFHEVLHEGFAASQPEVEVLAQVQRTRSLFARAELDATRQAFVDRKSRAYEAIDDAVLDPEGRRLARTYVDAFFSAIESDNAFYRPVVVADDARMYADPARRQPMCGAGAVPVGTPVSVPTESSGDMVRVLLLDALWSLRRCEAARKQAVWIPSSAIGTDYPR
jgi:hypothetical protein